MRKPPAVSTNFMTTKLTYILTIVLLICGSFTGGQILFTNELKSSNSKYSLTISTYNHAERIFEGILTYKLEENVLTISRRTIFSNEERTLFSKKVDSISLGRIRNIDLNKLKDFYFNKCIMMTSGNEYFVTTMLDTVSKTIHLHHYYNKQIEILINELNRSIADSLKIDYLTSDTKQDCK